MRKNNIFVIMLMVVVLLFAACSNNESGRSASPDGVWSSGHYAVLESEGSRGSNFPAVSSRSAESPMLPALSPVDTAPQATVPSVDNAAPDSNVQLAYGDTAAAQRMIIRSADLGLNTFYFGETVEGIHRIVANRGGFVESSHQWMIEAPHDNSLLLWRAEFVLRVPVGLFDRVNTELVDLAQVSRFSTVSEDVTMEFHDLTSRSRIREEELRRTELMLDAATNLNDILRLESQLTSLRLAVDAYQRRLTEIDQLASFSTIRLAVYEVIEICEIEEDEGNEAYYIIPPTGEDGFGTQLLTAFSASWDFVVSILTSIALFVALTGLPVVIFVVFGFVIYTILKKSGLIVRFRTAINNKPS